MNEEKLDKIIALLEELNERARLAGQPTAKEMQDRAGWEQQMRKLYPEMFASLQPANPQFRR